MPTPSSTSTSTDEGASHLKVSRQLEFDRGLCNKPPLPIKSGSVVALERTSFVPLYYQLQETLKQQIESGVWGAGDRLPSETELAAAHGVSRVVVRRALSILADDLQVRRVKGSGTYVAQPKLGLQAGGLTRALSVARPVDSKLTPIDMKTVAVLGPTRTALELGDSESAIRLTTLYELEGLPLSICYSYFRPEAARWLSKLVTVGRPLDPKKTLSDCGISWFKGFSEVETSLCGAFEAKEFGIPVRSAVFVVLATEYQRIDKLVHPLEVARVEYRGDIVKLLTE